MVDWFPFGCWESGILSVSIILRYIFNRGASRQKRSTNGIFPKCRVYPGRPEKNSCITPFFSECPVQFLHHFIVPMEAPTKMPCTLASFYGFLIDFVWCYSFSIYIYIYVVVYDYNYSPSQSKSCIMCVYIYMYTCVCFST
jgi:hypothetical protein